MKRWLFLLLIWATGTEAHEVRHRVEAAGAIVVTLSYANGEPFAYERYALHAAGQETPRQVGNTDAQGRVAFVPDATTQWRLAATSADGHGVNLEFAAPPLVPVAQAAPPAAEPAPRWLLAGFGLSLIFGLFGLAQLFSRKKP